MMMFSLIILAVVAGMPAAYEVDFRPLPGPEQKGANEYTIVLSFPGEPDVKISTTIARKYGPEGAAGFFVEALNDPRWKFKQDGPRVTVFGYDDVQIQKLTIEGNEPKPLARRVIAIPPQKKK